MDLTVDRQHDIANTYTHAHSQNKLYSIKDTHNGRHDEALVEEAISIVATLKEEEISIVGNLSTNLPREKGKAEYLS